MARQADAAELARLICLTTPLSVRAKGNARGVFEKLIAENRLLAPVLEQTDAVTGKKKLVVSEITAHITLDRAAAWLANPKPYLTNHLIEHEINSGNGNGFFLGLQDTALANLNGGMAVVVFDLCVDDALFSAALPSGHAQSILNIARPFILDAHRGYNVLTTMIEAASRFETHIFATGFRKRMTFSLEETAAHLPDPALQPEARGLYALERSELDDQSIHTFAGMALSYEPPRFRFLPSEQKLLQLAANGATDAECAQSLGISAETVKKKWLGIYEHTMTQVPTFFSGTDEQLGVRGPERKRKLLNYCRAHPQELRPHYLRRQV